jgi:hypothetical protein
MKELAVLWTVVLWTWYSAMEQEELGLLLLTLGDLCGVSTLLQRVDIDQIMHELDTSSLCLFQAKLTESL